MITKRDLQDSITSLRKEIKKDIKEAIDKAIIDFANSIIQVVATKEDLKKLATKDDLKKVKKELKTEIIDIKRQITDLKADTPAPEEFQNHEKRIALLEQAKPMAT